MKNTKTEGHNTNMAYMTINVQLGDSGVWLSSNKKVLLNLSFYWETEIKETEDEPGCPEYFDIRIISLFEPLELKSEDGKIVMKLSDKINLVNIFTDDQIEQVISVLKGE